MWRAATNGTRPLASDILRRSFSAAERLICAPEGQTLKVPDKETPRFVSVAPQQVLMYFSNPNADAILKALRGFFMQELMHDDGNLQSLLEKIANLEYARRQAMLSGDHHYTLDNTAQDLETDGVSLLPDDAINHVKAVILNPVEEFEAKGKEVADLWARVEKVVEQLRKNL